MSIKRLLLKENPTLVVLMELDFLNSEKIESIKSILSPVFASEFDSSAVKNLLNKFEICKGSVIDKSSSIFIFGQTVVLSERIFIELL